VGAVGLWIPVHDCAELCRIFFNNCFKNGMLPLTLKSEEVATVV